MMNEELKARLVKVVDRIVDDFVKSDFSTFSIVKGEVYNNTLDILVMNVKDTSSLLLSLSLNGGDTMVFVRGDHHIVKGHSINTLNMNMLIDVVESEVQEASENELAEKLSKIEGML